MIGSEAELLSLERRLAAARRSRGLNMGCAGCVLVLALGGFVMCAWSGLQGIMTYLFFVLPTLLGIPSLGGPEDVLSVEELEARVRELREDQAKL